MVRSHVADGMVREHIAAVLGISVDTLRKHYRDELAAADQDWNAKFQQTIKARVLREDCPPALVIFAAKVLLGWRELTPKDPDRHSFGEMSDAELSQLVAERARGYRDKTAEFAESMKRGGLTESPRIDDLEARRV